MCSRDVWAKPRRGYFGSLKALRGRLRSVGFTWWVLENTEVLDDQNCAKDRRMNWRRGRRGLEKTGSYLTAD